MTGENVATGSEDTGGHVNKLNALDAPRQDARQSFFFLLGFIIRCTISIVSRDAKTDLKWPLHRIRPTIIAVEGEVTIYARRDLPASRNSRRMIRENPQLLRCASQIDEYKIRESGDDHP